MHAPDRGRRQQLRQIVVDGSNYELHARTYDSFGEQAYRVRLRRA
jgi:hypothetical protein